VTLRRGISLECVDQLFDEVDAVAAGEEQTFADKVESVSWKRDSIVESDILIGSNQRSCRKLLRMENEKYRRTQV
jgi:hypothetical protein